MTTNYPQGTRDTLRGKAFNEHGRVLVGPKNPLTTWHGACFQELPGQSKDQAPETSLMRSRAVLGTHQEKGAQPRPRIRKPSWRKPCPGKKSSTL